MIKTILILWCAIIILALIAILHPNKVPKKQAKRVMVKEIKDSCNWCSVVRTYSLNVNNHHYGE